MSELLLDRAGRRRCPATMPGFHAGRPPHNRGLRYPADPPKVEEIVAVMRAAGDGAHGRRLRALIVLLRPELPVGALLCVITGTTCGRHWSPAAARAELRRTAAAAGVRRRFAPHRLRHAHAVEMAREGVPLIVIQRQLGHIANHSCSSREAVARTRSSSSSVRPAPAPGRRHPPNSRDTARAMSQANVDAFKRAFDAINRRDAEALLSELDPEVEWHGAILMAMGGDRTVYRGHEGVREWVRDLYETFSAFHADYQEILDLGDRTVGLGVVRGRGTASEAEIESPHGTVVEFKDGKGIRIRTYLDPKEALEAAGLQEQRFRVKAEGGS